MDMVNSAIISDRLSTLNAKIDLLYQKESINDQQLEKVRKERSSDFVDKNLNKATWHFGKYSNDFYFRNNLSSSSHSDATALFNREDHPNRRYSSLLPTISVRIECNGITYGPIRALLDSGAQPNIMDFSLFKTLKGLKTIGLKKRLVGIDGQPMEINRTALLRIRPWFESDEFIDEDFWILPKGSDRMSILPMQSLNKMITLSPDYQLADPNYHTPSETPLLLGVRIFSRIILAILKRDQHHTTLLQTIFGIVVMGSHLVEEDLGQVNSSIECLQDNRLDELIQRLWEMDRIKDPNSNSIRTMEQELVEQHFMDTHYRDGSGRFVVSIPIKKDIQRIGSSREIALRRFFCLERKLEANMDLKQFYLDQMREQLN